jgi:chromosome segregation ATPase
MSAPCIYRGLSLLNLYYVITVVNFGTGDAAGTKLRRSGADESLLSQVLAGDFSVGADAPASPKANLLEQGAATETQRLLHNKTALLGALQGRDVQIRKLQKEAAELRLRIRGALSEHWRLQAQLKGTAELQKSMAARDAQISKLKHQISSTKDRITQLRAQNLFSKKGFAADSKESLMNEASQSGKLWRQHDLLQEQNLQLRAQHEEQSDELAPVLEALEANTSHQMHGRDAASLLFKSLQANVTSLRKDLHRLLNERETVQAKLQKIEPLEHELTAKRAEVERLVTKVHGLEKAFTRVRAQLLFSGDVKLKRKIKEKGARDEALLQQKRKMEEEDLQWQAKIASSKRDLQALKAALRKAITDTESPAARERVALIKNTERAYAKQNAALRHKIQTLQQQLKHAQDSQTWLSLVHNEDAAAPEAAAPKSK